MKVTDFFDQSWFALQPEHDLVTVVELIDEGVVLGLDLFIVCPEQPVDDCCDESSSNYQDYQDADFYETPWADVDHRKDKCRMVEHLGVDVAVFFT